MCGASGSKVSHLRQIRLAGMPPVDSVLRGMTVNGLPSPPDHHCGAPAPEGGVCVHVPSTRALVRPSTPPPYRATARPSRVRHEMHAMGVGLATRRSDWCCIETFGRTAFGASTALSTRVPPCRSQSIFRTDVSGRGRASAVRDREAGARVGAYFALPSIQRPERAPAQKTWRACVPGRKNSSRCRHAAEVVATPCADGSVAVRHHLLRPL